MKDLNKLINVEKTLMEIKLEMISLQEAINKFDFPFVGTIKSKEFGENTRLTFVHRETVEQVRAVCENEEVLNLPLKLPMVAYFTRVAQKVCLSMVADVTLYHKTFDHRWYTNLHSLVDRQGEKIARGQFLRVCKNTLRWPSVRKTGVQFTLFPSGRKVTLDEKTYGDFRRCESPYFSRRTSIEDIVRNKELPCMVTFPANFRPVHELSNKTLLLEVQKTCDVVIATSRKRKCDVMHLFSANNDYQIRNICEKNDLPSSDYTKEVEFMRETIQRNILYDRFHIRLNCDSIILPRSAPVLRKRIHRPMNKCNSLDLPGNSLLDEIDSVIKIRHSQSTIEKRDDIFCDTNLCDSFLVDVQHSQTFSVDVAESLHTSTTVQAQIRRFNSLTNLREEQKQYLDNIFDLNKLASRKIKNLLTKNRKGGSENSFLSRKIDSKITLSI